MKQDKKSAPEGRTNAEKTTKHKVEIVSAIGQNRDLVEAIYDDEKANVRFAVWQNGRATIIDTYAPDERTRWVPARNLPKLYELGVVRLPASPMEYGETEDLTAAIRAYIRRYVDVSEAFETLAAHYVLLTWVYDRFKELPYLRRRGDYGTGKTRFLTVIGSICYKAIFAAGASTASPIFHMLDQIRGTLIIDEADYRFSDESALITKILNSGNVDGYPLLRSESVNGKDFKPRAFRVYGPKILAMRGRYDDPALESRFLTETNPNPSERLDIPVNLPSEQEAEAKVLRGKLLLWRFRNFEHMGVPAAIDAEYKIEPRMRQILGPLLAVVPDEGDQTVILKHGSLLQEALADARAQSIEAEVLVVLRKLLQEEPGAGVSVAIIAKVHGRAYFAGLSKPFVPRSMGNLLRTKLNLKTRKSNGVYVVPKTEAPVLERLYSRFGVTDDDVAYLRERLGEETHVDFGDVGDVHQGGHPKSRLNYQ